MSDPRSFKELVKVGIAAKYAEEKRPPINKDTFLKFLENTGLIMAGTAAGYGAGELTRRGLKKVVPGAHPRIRQGLLLASTLAGGAGAGLLKKKMEEEKHRRINEAYQRGLREGKRVR